jgi:hypothetical protein
MSTLHVTAETRVRDQSLFATDHSMANLQSVFQQSRKRTKGAYFIQNTKIYPFDYSV